MTRSRIPNGRRLAAAVAVGGAAAAAAFFSASTASAAAPYQWRDENGRMTFSDRPPPASVRRADVLRHADTAPRTGAPAAAVAPAAGSDRAPTTAGTDMRGAAASSHPPGAPAGAAPATASSGAAALPAAVPQPPASASGPAAGGSVHAAPAAPASVQARELAFRKRRLDQAQAERAEAERRAQAERLARACDDARGQLRALESGLRLIQVGPSGEREPVDEPTRERRLGTVRQELREHCAGS